MFKIIRALMWIFMVAWMTDQSVGVIKYGIDAYTRVHMQEKR